MTYAVKELFYTLQGEGANAGRPGGLLPVRRLQPLDRPRGRPASAVCRFCDTDFVGTDGPGGGRFADGAELAAPSAAAWPADGAGRRFVVCTGGEPLLQLDAAAARGPAPARLRGRGGDQRDLAAAGRDRLALREPQGRARPSCCTGATSSSWFSRRRARSRSVRAPAFAHFFLQPMDGPDPGRQHLGGPALLPRPSALAAEPADP